MQQNLALCDNQQKRLALDALDIRVTATQEDIDIRAAIPIELTPMPSSEEFITIGQTSGSLFRCRYSYIEGRGYALSRA